MPTISSDSSSVARTRARSLLRRGRWWLLTLAVLLFMAAVAWWALLFQILPRIGTWREALAQQATKALGVPVQIGAVMGRAEGWSPVLSLKDVVLLDERGSIALRLPEVTARISPASLWPTALWKQEVRMDRLVLVRPELQIRRDPAGVLHVAGLKLASRAPSAEKDGRVLDWVLSQRLIRIEKGTVRWTDELRQAPTLVLQQVDLDLRKHTGLGTQVHDLALQATPLPEFGQRFDVKARMSQPLWALTPQEAASKSVELPWWRRWLGEAPKITDWKTWSGNLKVNLPNADVQSLRAHVDLPIDVKDGHGRMGAELALRHGLPTSLALDLDVQDVNIRLEKGLQPLAFQRLKGRVTAMHERTVSRMALENLAFTTAEGLVWPASSARLEWRHAPLGGQFNSEVWRQTVGGQIDADRLDLALLATLADRLPLSASMRRTLADLAPKGVGRQLVWRWEGPADDPVQYKASGQIKDFGWAPSAEHKRPGLAEADIDMKADEHGGQASVTIKKGWVELPGAFEEPRIPLNDMAAQVAWTVSPSGKAGVPAGLQVDVKKASFANEDAEGELEASWRTGTGTEARFPGHLDLEGKLAWGMANRVWRYLPSVIPFHARDYVRMAVREGRGEKVKFEVKGDLAGFPFKDDQGGRFRVLVPARNVTLDYVPAALLATPGAVAQTRWPAFTNLDGDLIFEGLRMRIEGAKAQLGGLGSGSFLLKDVEGRIDNLAADDPHLEIQGQGQGPLNDLLRYMAVSPVGVWTGNLLHQAEGTGTGNLQLALNIPLHHTAETGLRGRVTLAEQDQAGLRLHPGMPLLQKVRGHVEFTQKTLKVSALTNVWGQDIAIEGQQDATGAPRFVAQGVVTAEGLRTASEWPALAQIAQRMTGQTPVTVTVALPKAADQPGASAQPELQVVSSLQGLAVDLPAPLSKPASLAWPLKLTHRGDDPKGLSDALLVELGAAQSANASGLPWLRADYRRDISGPSPKVTRGALSLVQSTGGGATAVPVMPPAGVVAQVTVPTLDLDAWQGLAKVIRPPSPSGGAAANNAGPGEDYLPDTLSLRAGTLNYQQRTLRNVSATLAHPSPGVWRAQIDSDRLAGQIEMRPETAPLASGPNGNRVVARLSRLSVPEAEAQAFEDQAALQLLTPEPSTVPALDIVIDEFEWRGRPLGKVEVEAINRLVPGSAGGWQPEWRLNRLRMTNPEAQLSASGNWMAVGLMPGSTTKPRQKASFNFLLELSNSGGLLGRLGLPQTLKGGKGKLTGQISWMGSPLEPNPATMSGELTLDIKEGQFLKVDPGMAKLLGVLSLQSLPRRLVLDFRDVFQQGFAFDAIDGEASIKQGVADTRNLRMRGVQAVVMMEGQADLAHETQDLHVYVVPEVNAGTASLAYAVINPAVGLGTFVAQMLLRKQVAEASTREFKVSGSWADPQVERVHRPLLAPAAGAASQPQPADVKAPKTPS